MITEKDLIAELQQYYNETGKTPSCETFPKSWNHKRIFGTWNNALKAANIPIHFKPNSRQEHPCGNCGKLTKNPKFCTSNCAATKNNKEHPKRKRKECICKICNTASCQNKRTICDDCKTNFNNLTLKELRFKAPYGGNQFNYIRMNARSLCQEQIKAGCKKCGYNKHVHVCHIIPVASFPDTATVKEINSKDNLIVLCPNCHWELDHLN